MDEFITNARAANPSIKIIIGDVLSRYDFWGLKYIGREQALDVNARYAALAATRTKAGSPVRAAPVSSWDAKAHTWDGVHPNWNGEEHIARAFAIQLRAFGIGDYDYEARLQDPKYWHVCCNSVRLTSVNRGIRLNWDPVPGATGYVIAQRIDSLGQTDFTKLPVPMGAHTFTWTAQGLLPGWYASYLIIPVKGVTQGTPGYESTGRVGGTPPTTQPALFGYPHNGSDHMARLTWTAVPNATGYYIEQMDLAAAVPTWHRLDWAVSTTSFDPGFLQPGHWYRFRVIPANGALFGPPSDPVDIRTTGTSHYLGYYALGDSFSSGLGTGGYSGGACYRSSGQAWPYLARQSWEPAPTHLACASDKTADLMANQVTRIMDFPGTVLITLTIGGNDVDFGPVALRCWRQNCTPEESSIAARIDAMGPALRNVYRTLRTKAPGADIVVAGYPKLIMPPETANCSYVFGTGVPGVADGFRDDEKRMVRRLAARLNGMIQRIGAEENVLVAVNEVSAWFDGHEACAGAAGEYVNQVDCGVLPLGCPGSLHPNAGGQLAYAYAVNQARRRLAEQGDVRY
jgi:lysophospholipase L1-like esterase